MDASLPVLGAKMNLDEFSLSFAEDWLAGEQLENYIQILAFKAGFDGPWLWEAISNRSWHQ